MGLHWASVQLYLGGGSLSQAGTQPWPPCRRPPLAAAWAHGGSGIYHSTQQHRSGGSLCLVCRSVTLLLLLPRPRLVVCACVSELGTFEAEAWCVSHR